jgi:branched-subunit amino acid ABC-type transport system permease component
LTALGVSLLLQNVALKAFSPDTRHFPSGISNRRYPRLDVAETLVRAGAVFDTDVCYLDENGNERLLTAAGAELNDAKLRLAEKHSPSGYYSYPAVTVTAKQIIIWTSVLVMTAGLQFLVRYTRMGKAMRAVSHDLDAAQLMGINTNAVISFTFFVGAFLAGAGGVLVGSYYNTIKPSMGVMYGLKAFVAAVLGGIGSINGAVLGGIVLGISERIVKLSPATAPYDHAFAFTVLVVILVFMPRGLLGRREGEKV